MTSEGVGVCIVVVVGLDIPVADNLVVPDILDGEKRD